MVFKINLTFLLLREYLGFFSPVNHSLRSRIRNSFWELNGGQTSKPLTWNIGSLISECEILACKESIESPATLSNLGKQRSANYSFLPNVKTIEM